MSMHKIPLTELEREGLNRHHLVVDAPSHLSDGFRLGMKWAHDNASADGWIEVDGAKNIPIGDWMVATFDKESKVATHIAKCRPNVIVIGGHFHFDMPKVYAYKEIGELPNLRKAASCGE